MKKKHITRVIRHFIDEEGKHVVQVPLDSTAKKNAIVLEKDFDELIQLGLSPIWCTIPNRKRSIVAVWNNPLRRYASVARMVANAGPGQAVSFANGNTFDLRSTNLVVGLGEGTRKDRDFIRPARGPKVVKHEFIK